MRGKHHWTVILHIQYYDEWEDEPDRQEILYETNKRAKADDFVYTHRHLENLDSDYVYSRLWIRKDY